MNTNQATCNPENRFERLCKMYDRAYELQLHYKNTGQKYEFWRMTGICLRLLQSKMKCLHN